MLISPGRGRRRWHMWIGGWFVRQSPNDTAGVLSPPATIAVVLALMVVVALSIRAVRADAAFADPAEGGRPAMAENGALPEAPRPPPTSSP